MSATSGLGAGGTTPATAYGLPVDANGLGAYTFSIGFHGAAFGVANFTVLDIYQIMLGANNSAVSGEPWDSNIPRRSDGQAVIAYGQKNQPSVRNGKDGALRVLVGRISAEGEKLRTARSDGLQRIVLR